MVLLVTNYIRCLENEKYEVIKQIQRAIVGIDLYFPQWLQGGYVRNRWLVEINDRAFVQLRITY